MSRSAIVDKTGVLFVVSTPIGNLEDITMRAIETLRGVDLIACEDTRKSRVLLQRWGIPTRLVSLHRFTEQSKIGRLLQRLKEGEDIALISDAGTPVVSDPGRRFVRAALDSGIRVTPIPGASAIMTALSVSGVDCSSFVFLGFVPRQNSARRMFFEEQVSNTRTSVFFETPKRIRATLEVINEVLGSRPMMLLRELTKIHEETIWGTAIEISDILEQRDSVKGEITVVMPSVDQPQCDVEIEAIVKTLVQEGFTGKRLADEASRRFHIKKRTAYDTYLAITSHDED